MTSTSTGPVGVGIIGAGVISEQYLTHLTSFPDVAVLAIGDIVPEAAASRAGEYGIELHGGPEVVLDHPGIEIVVNLTIPTAHFDVSRRIVEAGKHVWTEKPITTASEDAAALLALAAEKGVRVGGAPDTVLGAGIQTALRTLREGTIGTPASALTLFQTPGPEDWHPNPAFLFQEGAGPLFDIAPYYVTTLVLALGPVQSVSAAGSKAREQRTIGSGPKAGEVFDVTVPTQVTSILRFESGQNATTLLSFDNPNSRAGFVEVYGTEATLSFPDPNVFDGDSELTVYRGKEATAIPAAGPVTGRGLGVLEMARAIRAGVPHRGQGEIAAHVLDVMLAIEASIGSGETVEVASSFTPVEPMPADFDPFATTL
ncbi:Gfo/Idh/MocA family oxidoreductase [Brachybacterium sp. NBEC-018]|uniref:Gfo/Idh/MocA family protein n=1 Tax=Brachybacterium sp. NBEC-018 TaxID=2996004 RepID=UPI00217546A9|nr:Gfo/Idh/MocA family oxidoreductase [Brachybacterium sp. NBEC-018]UVY82769.1 Gfo/Idh/MocA family oxidoreductase [Brachybacterium sp. NBEC-018]